MSDLQAIFDNPLSVIGGFFIVVFAIQKLYELGVWIKARLDDYHGEVKKKEDIDEEREKLKKQVEEISEISSKHTETLTELTKAIESMNENISKRLDRIEEKAVQDQVISDRATIYHLYETLIDREYLTIAENECFENVANRYMANGGNGAFRQNIIPSIIRKPVKDEFGHILEKDGNIDIA